MTLLRRKIIEPTRYLYEEIDGVERVYPNPSWVEYNNKKLIKLNVKKAGIPRDYWDLEFSMYQGALSHLELNQAIQYAKNCKLEKFENVSLYLYGPNSSQKTMIACAILKECIYQGLKTMFVLAGDLTSLLLRLQGYSRLQEDLDLLKQLQECDIICIDDIFDPKKSTLWKNSPELVISALDPFLRNRFSQDKRVLFTSNFSLESIVGTYGRSLKELVDRDVYQLEFKDPIKKVRQDRFKNLFD